MHPVSQLPFPVQLVLISRRLISIYTYSKQVVGLSLQALVQFYITQHHDLAFIASHSKQVTNSNPTPKSMRKLTVERIFWSKMVRACENIRQQKYVNIINDKTNNNIKQNY